METVYVNFETENRGRIMKLTKLFAAFLSAILLLSLCSCVEEESEETLKMPPMGSMVEYRISDTEYLRVLYNDYDSNYGEWIKDGETTKLLFDTNEEYWGILSARYGITQLNISVSELIWGEYELEEGEVLATTDEGFLNSTALTVAQTGEVLPIQNITVTENYEGNFDWATPEWKAFCSSKQNEYYEIEKLSVTINSVTREGEWVTNDITVPIKIVFDDWLCQAEIFDISDEDEKKIFFGKGHMEDGAFVIDEVVSTMFYENSVTDIKIKKISPVT